MRGWWTVTVLVGLATAEIIDRVCVMVDRKVITLSAVDERIRVAALLNGTAADLSAASRRRMAERLIEQALIEREMEISRYSMPKEEEVTEYLERLRKQGKLGARALAAKLGEYRLTEAALRENLRLQLATVRFIDLRFRPGSAVSDGEIELYYRETYVPEWQREHAGKTPPEVDEVWDTIEQTLLAQKANEALEAWLKEARASARVIYFEEAFR